MKTGTDSVSKSLKYKNKKERGAKVMVNLVTLQIGFDEHFILFNRMFELKIRSGTEYSYLDNFGLYSLNDGVIH